LKNCIHKSGLFYTAAYTFLFSISAVAQVDSSGMPRFKFETSAEYLVPTNSNRHIYTQSLNELMGVEFFDRMPLSLYGGITITHPWGSQQDDQSPDTSYHNNTIGAGPVFMFRFEPFVLNRFSVSHDISGGIIFYLKEFPVGGAHYNFMWRVGFSAHYRFTNRIACLAYYRWMHVSNGQGLGPQNPAYEGRGPGAGISFYF